MLYIQIKRILTCILLFISLQTVAAEESNECQHWPSWSKHACHRLHQVWTQGDNELYMTGYAWHNRYIYPRSRINNYNELAWGGGFGKGFYDEDGDWHGLSAIAFLDSHKHVEPAAGYSFLKILHLNENTRIGAGYSILITARPDILHNIPFPGVLPWLSFGYRKATVCVTYIPGAKGTGNVLFFLARWAF